MPGFSEQIMICKFSWNCPLYENNQEKDLLSVITTHFAKFITLFASTIPCLCVPLFHSAACMGTLREGGRCCFHFDSIRTLRICIIRAELGWGRRGGGFMWVSGFYWNGGGGGGFGTGIRELAPTPRLVPYWGKRYRNLHWGWWVHPRLRLCKYVHGYWYRLVCLSLETKSFVETLIFSVLYCALEGRCQCHYQYQKLLAVR